MFKWIKSHYIAVCASLSGLILSVLALIYFVNKRNYSSESSFVDKYTSNKIKILNKKKSSIDKKREKTINKLNELDEKINKEYNKIASDNDDIDKLDSDEISKKLKDLGF